MNQLENLIEINFIYLLKNLATNLGLLFVSVKSNKVEDGNDEDESADSVELEEGEGLESEEERKSLIKE